MSKITTASMTRRAFVAGAVATSAAIAMAANGLREPVCAFADEDVAEPDEDTSGAVQGGTLTYYLTNPVGIEPYTAEENQGVEVVYNLFDTLVSWDWGNERVEPLAAESLGLGQRARRAPGRRELGGQRRRDPVHLPPAQGRQVPQRPAGDLQGLQVLLGAQLQRRHRACPLFAGL